jgi:hypothetical protein
MSNYKTHLRKPNWTGNSLTLCGLGVTQYTKHGEKQLPLASKLHHVDCSNCLSIYYKDANNG